MIIYIIIIIAIFIIILVLIGLYFGLRHSSQPIQTTPAPKQQEPQATPIPNKQEPHAIHQVPVSNNISPTNFVITTPNIVLIDKGYYKCSTFESTMAHLRNKIISNSY